MSASFSELSTFARYTATLPGYLRRRMTSDQARRRLADALASREENFLRVMERGYSATPAAPTSHFFDWPAPSSGTCKHWSAPMASRAR